MVQNFDQFQKEKSDFLGKMDKSKKGSIDKDIAGLIKIINSKSDFYTTSSCAGRIVLLEMKSRRKNECVWVFAKHEKVNFEEINGSLKNKKSNHQIWFKQQPLILHVACRNTESAKKFLDLSRKLFKKAGIIGLTQRKVTIEVAGSEHLETIAADKNFSADEKYLKKLIECANRNFSENKRKIKKFEKIIRRLQPSK